MKKFFKSTRIRSRDPNVPIEPPSKGVKHERPETPDQKTEAEPERRPKKQQTRSQDTKDVQRVPFDTKTLCNSPAVEVVRPCYFDHVPNEILTHIFSFLPRLVDNLKARLVCKRWLRAAKHPLAYTVHFRIGDPWRKNERILFPQSQVMAEGGGGGGGGVWMVSQPHLKPRMREILINWLVEVHVEFRLEHQALFLAIAYLDRLLVARPRIERTRFQLYGLTCLWLAAKYECSRYPSILHLVWMCDDAYTHEDFENSEVEVLRLLNWRLTQVTPLSFLDEFHTHCTDPLPADRARGVRYLSYLLLELSLLDFQFQRQFFPSVIATSAICVARQSYGLKPAPGWLLDASGYDPMSFVNSPVRSCARELCKILANAPRAIDQSFIMEKYRHAETEAVSTRAAPVQVDWI